MTCLIASLSAINLGKGNLGVASLLPKQMRYQAALVADLNESSLYSPAKRQASALLAHLKNLCDLKGFRHQAGAFFVFRRQIPKPVLRIAHEGLKEYLREDFERAGNPSRLGRDFTVKASVP